MTARGIDVQSHYMPDAQWRALAAAADRDPDFRRLVGRFVALEPSAPVRRLDEARVAEMEAAGIDQAVISMPPPGAAFFPREGAAERAEELNTGLIEAAARFPGRFIVLASLPLPHVEESLAELERLVGARSSAASC